MLRVAETRVEHDPVSREPLGDRHRGPLLEEVLDVGDDVGEVEERLLLVPDTRVQDDERRVVRGAQASDLEVGEARHVVDHAGAGLERRARDDRIRRVDRDGDPLGDERLDERDGRSDLLIERDRRAVGDARVGADVDDARTLGDERHRALHLRIEAREMDGVGERAGVRVDDAHHDRTARLERERVLRRRKDDGARGDRRAHAAPPGPARIVGGFGTASTPLGACHLRLGSSRS
jgi:hypothetical protein